MKHHIAFKFLAVFLCALALLTGMVGSLGIYAIADQGLYTYSAEEIYHQRMYQELSALAENLTLRYAMESLSNCPESLIDAYAGSYYLTQFLTPKRWFYTLEDSNGKTLKSTFVATGEDATRFEFVIAPEYPVVLSPNPPTTQPEDPTAETVSPDEELYLPEDYDNTHYFQWEDRTGKHEYELGMQTAPAFLLTLHLLDGAYTAADEPQWALLETGHTHRYTLLAAVVFALLVFALSMVYLCCAAGKSPSRQDVRPGGLNLLPLDLYLGLTVAGGFGCVALIQSLFWWTFQEKHFLPGISVMLLTGFGVCLLLVGTCFAAAAQSKLPDGYWWRHTLLGTVIRLLVRLVRWTLHITGTGIRWVLRTGKHLFSLLPMVWQWIVTAAAMGLLLIITALLRDPVWMILALLICAGVVLYRIYCFGTLLDGARRMSKGNLNTKIPLTWLLGSFRELAQHLNRLDDAAVISARKQMQSERMKAELVTNVSHDLKTPLTSIINYVDLLQNAGSAEESAEYLEVLSRQSQRMKKLIDDLVEMNKAATGNMSVELTRMDAAEAINQALGEFSDKLAAKQLEPIFQPPAETVTMLADGRLTWRVLSNLLSNAVKYALPGTRLYIDLHQLEGSVLISLKNISKEQLNVSSDELLERFVRGDASRNTEGSGLGLNIAKSLMELQHGKLRLMVDGDLFKVTLVFPEANAAADSQNI